MSQDVVFSVANQKAMTFVGGGAKNWTQWAKFLGLVKDKRFPHAGSPFQVCAIVKHDLTLETAETPNCGTTHDAHAGPMLDPTSRQPSPWLRVTIVSKPNFCLFVAPDGLSRRGCYAGGDGADGRAPAGVLRPGAALQLRRLP